MGRRQETEYNESATRSYLLAQSMNSIPSSREMMVPVSEPTSFSNPASQCKQG